MNTTIKPSAQALAWIQLQQLQAGDQIIVDKTDAGIFNGKQEVIITKVYPHVIQAVESEDMTEEIEYWLGHSAQFNKDKFELPDDGQVQFFRGENIKEAMLGPRFD